MKLEFDCELKGLGDQDFGDETGFMPGVALELYTHKDVAVVIPLAYDQCQVLGKYLYRTVKLTIEVDE